MKLKSILIGLVVLGFAALSAQWAQGGGVTARFSSDADATAFQGGASAQECGGAIVTHNEDGTTSVELPNCANPSDVALDAIAEHANAVAIAECPCWDAAFIATLATGPTCQDAFDGQICDFTPFSGFPRVEYTGTLADGSVVEFFASYALSGVTYEPQCGVAACSLVIDNSLITKTLTEDPNVANECFTTLTGLSPDDFTGCSFE